VTNVGFSPPATGAVGVPIRVTGNVTVRNFGPTAPVIADITFAVSAPSDCTISPVMPDIVQNRSLPLGQNVFIGRVWMVTCLLPGPHQFDVTVTAAPDLQGYFDPDTTNDSMSNTGTTQVN
jgi:hypothetical protein